MNHDKHNQAVIAEAKRNSKRYKASEAARRSVRVGGKKAAGGCCLTIILALLFIAVLFLSCYAPDDQWPRREPDDPWKRVAAVVLLVGAGFAAMWRKATSE